MKLLNMKLPKLNIPKIKLSKIHLPIIKLNKLNNMYLLMIMFLIIIISPLVISFFQEGMENKKKKRCKDKHKHPHSHSKHDKKKKNKNDEECDCKIKGNCKKNKKRKNMGIHKSDIPEGDEDLYILKSQIVPPVCPECPDMICNPDEKRKRGKKYHEKRQRHEEREKHDWDRKQKHGWERHYSDLDHSMELSREARDKRHIIEGGLLDNNTNSYKDTTTSFPTIFPSWNSLMERHKSKSTVQLDGPNNKTPMPMLNDFSNF